MLPQLPCILKAVFAYIHLRKPGLQRQSECNRGVGEKAAVPRHKEHCLFSGSKVDMAAAQVTHRNGWSFEHSRSITWNREGFGDEPAQLRREAA